MGVTRVKPTFQSPQYTSPPTGSPIGAPIERDAHLQSLFYILLRVPSKGALPSQSPSTRALLQVPQLEPLLKEMPISRAFSTYP
jgi:hypothetical protein